MLDSLKFDCYLNNSSEKMEDWKMKKILVTIMICAFTLGVVGSAFAERCGDPSKHVWDPEEGKCVPTPAPETTADN